MKNRSVYASALILMALSFVLAACGGGGGGSGSPVDAAKAFLEATTKFDKDKVLSLVCKAEKDAMEKQFAGMPALPADQLKDLKVDLSNVKLEVVSQSGDTAEIKGSGKMKITMAGQSQEQEVGGGPNTIMKNEGGWKYCGLKK